MMPDKRFHHWLPVILWTVAASLLIYMASIDLYNREQFILSASALLMILFLRIRYLRTLHDARPLRLTRLLLLVLIGVLALRYLIWRIQYSIPWHDDTLSLLLSLMLLIAEVFSVALYFLGSFTVIHPLRREPVPFDMDRDDLPTVDVFVPSYNESPELLRTTLLAATSIIYPADKLRVYLLDDGGTDGRCARDGEAGRLARKRRSVLQQLCEETGAHYLTRQDNVHAKAGNINAALPKTQGEIILVLDSDHVPTLNFLELTIGTFLKHPDIALVQTPHHMINQDPVEKSLHASRKMPAEGDMFYTMGLRGMDNWNAGFFCGSGALIKRSALEMVGGLCTETIVEDADTSMEMLSKGCRTAYLHIPVLAGLSAETIEAMTIQRQRWASGMIQLLRMKNPLFRKGLSFPQRISYINCIAYWFFVLARVVFIFTPVFALVFGVVFFAAPPSEIMLYLIPYLIGLYLVLNVLYGRVRWAFVSEIYDTINAVMLSGTVLRTLFKPQGQKFKVTPKEVSHEDTSLSPLAWRFYILLGIQCAASVYGGWLLMHDPGLYNQVVVSLAWNSYNIIFTLAALGALIEKREVRRHPRIAVEKVASLEIDGRHIPCHITDMTESGACLHLPEWVRDLNIKQGVLRFSDKNHSKAVSTILSFGSKIAVQVHSLREGMFRDKKTLVAGVSFRFSHIRERRMVINYLYGESHRWQRQLISKHQQSTITQGAIFLLTAVKYGLQHLWMRLLSPFRGRSSITSSSEVC